MGVMPVNIFFGLPSCDWLWLGPNGDEESQTRGYLNVVPSPLSHCFISLFRHIGEDRRDSEVYFGLWHIYALHNGG